MKKILYIITIPDWGGAQRYIFDLAENLKSDFDVTVAFGKKEKNNGLEDKCANRGIKTYKFKSLVRPINPIKDILAVFELKKYIDETKPDIIHLNSSKAGVLGSMAAAIAKHKPQIIYTVHGWVFLEPMNKLKKWLYIFLERLASRWRDKIIVLGKYDKQIALQYKICPENKLIIIPHTNTKIQFEDDARSTLNLPKDKKIIGTIANFYPSKGLNYLINAASHFKQEANIIFVIIGDGPLRQKMEKQIDDLKLQNKIFLLGRIENAAKYLHAFDIFVLPSVKEGLPYALLEAMQAGRRILATDVGNVAEALSDYQFINTGEGDSEDHLNKLLIPPANVEKLIQGIQLLLSKKQVQTVYGTNTRSLDILKKIYNNL